MSFAKEAWPFVLPFVVVSAGLLLFGRPVAAAVVAVLALAVLLFFRDPRRSFSGDPALVLAAADGVVTAVDEVEDAAVGDGRFRRVVTFLSAFDVHVQRVPVDGEVVASKLTPGRKVAAFRADAGEVNESYLTVLERTRGAARDRVAVRQIAGLMARRVVCYLRPGDRVERGQNLGLIKFGSRVDLLVPEDYEVLVERRQRLVGGLTPVARPRREGA